ncbi:protein kinase-like domain, concanavalin A-like lectin/glucanase domain protein, partial [Tanacetum coccineum]
MSTSITQFNHLRIPLEEILKATNNFSENNIIGKGGLGNIYKGQLLRSGELINVSAKRLDHNQEQGDVEFWREISILSSLKHPNIVYLIGFCDEEGEKIIINHLGIQLRTGTPPGWISPRYKPIHGKDSGGKKLTTACKGYYDVSMFDIDVKKLYHMEDAYGSLYTMDGIKRRRINAGLLLHFTWVTDKLLEKYLRLGNCDDHLPSQTSYQ